MGISYHPVAMFGVRFQKSREVREFLVTNTKNTDFYEADELDEKVQDTFPSLKIIPLDMFSTQECVLGYNMTLGETVEKYQAMWEKEFPNANVKPEPILAVRTW